MRFGQALLATMRTTAMYSADHPSAVHTAQQAFDLLNTLLKEGGPFTLGFVDSQVVLNNLLTKEPNLGKLESEFLKRGIAAVTFEPGLTFARFKRGIMVLVVRVSVLEAVGGLRQFLEQNPVEGVRVLPAQKKEEAGDTLLDTDSESYIVSRQMSEEQAPRDLLDSINSLLEAASFDAAARGTMLAGFGDAQQAGELAAAAGAGRASDAAHGGYDPGQPPKLVSFIDMTAAAIERSLADETANPRKCYLTLAKLLRDTRVDAILSYFPLERQPELRTMSPEEVAAEYVQDNALQWAGKRLTASDAGDGGTVASGRVEVEEDVVRVLARSLHATQMADRLAAKLLKFFQDYAVPRNIQEKIGEELRWTSLTTAQKHDSLMRMPRYSSLEFSRLLEHLKELVASIDFERATALASHYFDFLADPRVDIQPEELSRAGTLIRALPLARVRFAAKAIERLRPTLARADLSEFVHFQAANTLTLLAQAIAAFEDFDRVVEIGLVLQESRDRDPARHKKCCGDALLRLVAAKALERVVELYLSQRGDPAWNKKAVVLLRFAPKLGAEAAFRQLAEEADAKNRLALLRLISQLGREATGVARAFLSDRRWYVVRNMCGALADLKDPELATDLAPALAHADVRVQQAAMAALVKSRAPGRALAFAAALSKLAPSVLDEVLNELLFMKDPQTVPELEKLVVARGANPGEARKAVQVLTSIPGIAAAEALAHILRRREIDITARRLALAALVKARSPLLAAALRDIGADDPLAVEAQNHLAAAALF